MKILKLTILILFIGLANKSYSCTCIQSEDYNLKKGIKTTDVIITGRVIRIDTVNFDSFYNNPDEHIIILVDEVLKSDYVPVINIGDTVRITNSAGTCAYPFKVEETYLIFSNIIHYLNRPWIINTIGTDICTETSPLNTDGKQKLRKTRKYLRKD